MLDQHQIHQNSRLGLILIKRNYIQQEQLDIALQFQLSNQLRLGEALLQLGFINAKQLNRALRRQNWSRSIAAGIALVLTPFSPAFAASQGTAGASSTASSQISVTIAPKSIVSGGGNMIFDPRQKTGSTSDGICTNNLGADIYRVMAVGSGDGGKFSLARNDLSELNYQVSYQHSDNSFEKLDLSKASKNFQNTASQGGCGNAAMNHLRVSLEQTKELNRAQGYAGSMTLTIVPE